MTDQQIIQELLELIDAKMPSEKLDEHETTTVELARQAVPSWAVQEMK